MFCFSLFYNVNSFPLVSAKPNIVILVFNNGNILHVCEGMKKPLQEEFDNLGGIFKFERSKTEINEQSYKEVLQFLKAP